MIKSTLETHPNSIPPAGEGFIYVFNCVNLDWSEWDNPERWKKAFDEGLISKIPLPFNKQIKFMNK